MRWPVLVLVGGRGGQGRGAVARECVEGLHPLWRCGNSNALYGIDGGAKALDDAAASPGGQRSLVMTVSSTLLLELPLDGSVVSFLNDVGNKLRRELNHDGSRWMGACTTDKDAFSR